MKQNYLFAPLLILIIVIVSFFTGTASGQNNAENVKVITVKKQIISDSNDSVKVLVKRIETNDELALNEENMDSLIQELIEHQEINGEKMMKIIQITNGDTLITNCWDDSLANIWIGKFEMDSLQGLEKQIQKRMVFLNDSSIEIDFEMDFDSILDPLNKIRWEFVDGEAILEIEKIIETANLEEDVQKEIKVIMHHADSNMVFVGDDGEHIKIERNGEMLFINKKKNVKDVDSLIDVIEDKNGRKVIIVQTRIVLDEFTEDEMEGFKSQGLKTGNKEPEFDYIKFYPNPSTEGINLNFKLAEKGTVEVKISNMIGQAVFEEVLKNFDGEYNRKINLIENGKGTYILQIIQGNRVISRKIIVE